MTTEPKCPNCGSSDLRYGRMNNPHTTFCLEQGDSWLLSQYPVKAFACLDCGFLGQYLEPQSRETIRRKDGR